MNTLIETISIWSTAQTLRTSNRGRGASNQSLYGITKLRELILELAVRGKLVPQNPEDEPASVLLKRIEAEKKKLIKEGKIKKQEPLPEIEENEKPIELPGNWIWTKLGIISFINPRNDAKDDSLASFVPMPLITTSYTGNHGQEERLWGEIKQGYTHFANGDIGVAKITPCFENSKAVVFSDLINSVGAGTTELHIARPYGNTINARFVLLYLKAPQFLHLGETKMTGTAGQKRVPKDFFAENPFPLPPLPEQHRIVAKVDELMALCDRLEQQQSISNSAHEILVETLLDTLTNATDQSDFETSWRRIATHFGTLFTTEHSIDRLKQTILQLAVMGKLVPQNPEDEPASELIKKIAKEKARLIKEGKIKKQNPLPEIGEDEMPIKLPIGWELIYLGNIVSVMDAGGSPDCSAEPSPSNEMWGVLKTTAVQVLKYLEQENKLLPSNKEPRAQYEVKAGDILITRAGPKNRVAISCLVDKTRPKLMISDKIIRFHLFEVGIYERFISLCLNAGLTANYLENAKSGMAESQMNISQDKLRNAPIPLCPAAEQHRIVSKVDELFVLCDGLKDRINQAQVTQLNLATALVDGAVG